MPNFAAWEPPRNPPPASPGAPRTLQRSWEGDESGFLPQEAGQRDGAGA